MPSLNLDLHPPIRYQLSKASSFRDEVPILPLVPKHPVKPNPEHTMHPQVPHLSPELLSNILFGAAMFIIGIFALWQTYRASSSRSGMQPQGIERARPY